MGILVKLIGSGIGLASEAISHRKASKEEKAAAAAAGLNSNNGESSAAGASRSRSVPDYDEAPPEYVEVPDETAEKLIATGQAVPVDSKDEKHLYREDEEDVSEDDDEELWEMDDAAGALTESNTQEENARSPQSLNQLTDTFMHDHPPPMYTPGTPSFKRNPLPCPVILPQRRPRDKKRGFVRAYAPVLEDCGIDQATFLDFLKTFHASCKEDPWLQVVNMAAMAVGFVPNPIAMGVTIAVQFAVGVAMEVQRRTRTNSFLDRMNNEFFKPRGLYCLIMTYKPESTSSHSRVDITQTISSSMTPAASKNRQTLKNMRLSSGKTYGELELPEAAPLIFPALEDLADDNSQNAEKKKSAMKSSQKFVADYFDRRAQAKYIAENPNSKLAISPGDENGQKFSSRYADPNHPANSGSLISLLTGGHVNPKARKQQRRIDRRMYKAYRRGEEITPQTGKKRDGLVKKILKKDVLYLMIVNLPSDEELQAAGGLAAVAAEDR
ncbi:uncharacterized protein LY89DRAFT_683942 [Mollisia scopiformis]|uniref:Uncharacterized protein n=1 Tax=Mollisia scopiformis TaxID=149040 RepID=A0A194XCT1_MOLSC|nr:uncharacterized protein LY89DRAFT_683942 [Mollisia scopiformis]KUJ17980.1 hypothetical protein LY89DRAFT_683942 [Mollisia scopiformis]